MVKDNLNLSEYNSYFGHYIGLCNEQPLINQLESNLKVIVDFFTSIPEEKLLYQYAEHKWTPKQILQHITDTERVFAYRMLFIARSKNVTLQGFDENEFADTVQVNTKSISELINDFTAVRKATLSLLKGLTEEDLLKKGSASGSSISVRAAGFILIGHSMHHINVIQERYL